MRRIDVVKGDLLQELFRLNCVKDLSAVDSVHFSSAAQMIDVILAYSEKDRGYYLNLSNSQTAELTACSGKYDLTVVLKNGNRLTEVRNAPFVVWAKVNEIAREGNDNA